MQTQIVLGIAFGDEGKGRTVSSLSNADDLVIRFNGGHQAGHTVEYLGNRHVFSQFGSGTMKDAHTFWSEYCTFCPITFYNERKALREMGYFPEFFLHPMAMITTPFDVQHNRDTELTNQHGSVGVGFGSTIARNQNTPYKLYAMDLHYKELLIHKLRQIAQYYGLGIAEAMVQIKKFIEYTDQLHVPICTLSNILHKYKNVVFEGAQGIMLDMDFGFFPNVTRSHTTSRNAMQIIKEHNLPEPTVYYVMRSYLTRHGKGYMPYEFTRQRFSDATNTLHDYQGVFRQGFHSTELLNQAIHVDCIYSGYDFTKKRLNINCLDQTEGKMLMNGHEMSVVDFLRFMPHFDIKHVLVNEERLLIHDLPL